MTSPDLLRGPLHRLVLAVAAAGVLGQLAVAGWIGDRRPVTDLKLPDRLSPAALLVAVLLLTVVADLVAVRVRHGDQVEELTLYGSAVVVGVLVLPVVPALLVPVAASATCSLLRRRGTVKTVFNAGNLAAATAGLVAGLHLVSGAGQALSARTVLGLTLGSVAFAGLNLIGLSRVLALVTGGDAWRVVREGVRLSALEAVGTVALGGIVVSTAQSAPALLPFAFAPAAALTFAYRAAAQEAEERARSQQLLALSQVLAGRRPGEQVLEGFLDLSRQAFGADLALALVAEGELQDDVCTTLVQGAGNAPREAGAQERALLEGGPVGALTTGLPVGWVRALAAPLEADGRRIGTVVLATCDRHRPLDGRELALLSSLASALAGALRAGSHLRRLVAETSKLKAVVDHSSDGILVLDGEGSVQLWSPAVAALTGVPEAAALGRRVDELLAVREPAGAPVRFDDARSRLSPTAPTGTVELVLQRADGEQRVVRAAHAGVFGPDDDLERDVVIVHDVTRERQVDRLKSDFIATVSHELRTPVTPIKGYADLLLRHGSRMSPAKRHECLEVISDRASHLARLVEDLLLASWFSGTGGAPAQVDHAPADLGALTRRACQDFGDEGQRVQLDVPAEPLPVLCDRVRVIQVLTNLVGNALKYSAPGTPVLVTCRNDSGWAVVTVTDRGRGIPADQLERVFDKFHRVEDPLRMTTSGTGLGLYIARQLASAMSGTLSCRSTLGEGSEFDFALPVRDPADDPAVADPPPGLPGLPGLRPRQRALGTPAAARPGPPAAPEPARTLG